MRYSLLLLLIISIPSILYPAEGFKGTVLDTNKNPIDGVNIKIWSAATGAINTKTNAQGTFSIELKSGKYAVRISKDGFEDKKIPVLTILSGKRASVNLVLNKTGAQPAPQVAPAQASNNGIKGSVTDPARNPIPEVDLKIWSKETGAINFKTDKKGLFNIQLNPGNYAIRISKQGFVEKKVSLFTLVKDKWAQLDIQLDRTYQAPPSQKPPEALNQGLLGFVFDEQDKPVKDATVNILKNKTTLLMLKTDKKGQFKTELSTGNFSVQITKTDYPIRTFESIEIEKGKWSVSRFVFENKNVKKEITEVKKSTETDQGITVYIVDANDKPIERVTVIISDEYNKSQQMVTGSGGSIKIKAYPGSIYINAEKESYDTSKREKTRIKSGEWKELRIRLYKFSDEKKPKEKQTSVSVGLILMAFLVLTFTALH